MLHLLISNNKANSHLVTCHRDISPKLPWFGGCLQLPHVPQYLKPCIYQPGRWTFVSVTAVLSSEGTHRCVCRYFLVYDPSRKQTVGILRSCFGNDAFLIILNSGKLWCNRKWSSHVRLWPQQGLLIHPWHSRKEQHGRGRDLGTLVPVMVELYNHATIMFEELTCVCVCNTARKKTLSFNEQLLTGICKRRWSFPQHPVWSGSMWTCDFTGPWRFEMTSSGLSVPANTCASISVGATCQALVSQGLTELRWSMVHMVPIETYGFE